MVVWWNLLKMAKIKKPVFINHKTVIKIVLKVLLFYDSSYPKDTWKS